MYHSATFPADDVALDTPAQASFLSGWSDVAQHVGSVAALPERIGQFASVTDPARFDPDDLCRLAQSRQTPLVLLQKTPIALPKCLTLEQDRLGVQMVFDATVRPRATQAHQVLGVQDRHDMLALAEVAKPGPFRLDTPSLGTFIGIRVGGRLIAMAGQRMRFPGWTEISGVCVHPEFRRKGLAQGLVLDLVQRILDDGSRPFLHTFAENSGAIALYEALNFRLRTEMSFQVISAR